MVYSSAALPHPGREVDGNVSQPWAVPSNPRVNFDDSIEIIHRLAQEIARDSNAHGKIARFVRILQGLMLLTPREREILVPLVRGKLPKVIARELGIARKTFDIHRANILRKMHVETAAELTWLLLAGPGPYCERRPSGTSPCEGSRSRRPG
jgi:DNA-binding CsgD family transcriptional regulator